MFKIISRETTRITPERARKLLEYNTFNAQRRLKKHHLARLVSAINSGDFTTGNLAFASNGDGIPVLMNGQHQLNAVIKTGKPIYAYVEHTECETGTDMSRYFGQFDVGATRSISDITRAEIDTIGVDWLGRTGSTLVSALAHIDNKGNYRAADNALTKHERAKKVKMFVPEGDFLNELFSSNESLFLRKVPVAVAILITFKKDQRWSHDFWMGVKTGANLDVDDPRLHLRNFLITCVSVGNNRSNIVAQRRASSKELIVRSIHAWNAWTKGERRKVMSPYRADSPIPAARKPIGHRAIQTTL